MQYKAVGFDYGGVIGGTTGPNFSARASQVMGIDQATYREIFFSLNHKINLGEIASWREFWVIFLDKLGKPEKLSDIMTLNDEESQNLRVINPAMLALVNQLRAAGFKTGLLSNTTLEGGRQMRAQGLDRHFDAFLISAEMEIMKPNPQAFAHLADELGVQLGELIFIDDTEKSLSTAKECGFTPILFEDRESLIRQLSAVGISV